MGLSKALIVGACTVLAMASACRTSGGMPDGAAGSWTLVWKDDFNGNGLNHADWSETVQGLNWNNEDQAFVKENASVKDGCLVLTAKREHWAGPSNRVDDPDLRVTREYTSAEVYTKRSWTFGRFEARIKAAGRQGVLSAVWLTPLDKDWPPEIDAVEILGHNPHTAYFTNHFSTPADHRMSGNKFVYKDDFSATFHTFTVEWEPGIIRWYVDGVKKAESTSGVPDEPFILRLSLPVGSDWEGDPGPDSVFPQRMLIDWVRVYRR